MYQIFTLDYYYYKSYSEITVYQNLGATLYIEYLINYSFSIEQWFPNGGELPPGGEFGTFQGGNSTCFATFIWLKYP